MSPPEEDNIKDKLFAAFAVALGTALAQELVKDAFAFVRRRFMPEKADKLAAVRHEEDEDGAG